MEKQVLLVDPEHQQMKTLKEALRHAGYKVWLADSVAVANLILQDVPIDLVLLEVKTPRGYESEDGDDPESENWQTSWPGYTRDDGTRVE